MTSPADTFGTSAETRPDKTWRAIVEALPDPALALDENSAVAHFNRRVLTLFPSAKVGAPVSQVTRNPDFLEAVERAKSIGATTVDLHERVPLERRISATITRLDRASAKASLPALLVVFRDLTEQDRLEQMRVDFVANASHELRTPLSLLLGYVETLQGPARNDPAAREKFLSNMWTQADRMTRLVDDLLSLSRVEMRVHLPPSGIVELNDVAATVAQTMEPIASAHGTTIAVARLADPARIRGEREEIIQVLQNLVHNAIKYGRENGRIEIVPARLNEPGRKRSRISVEVRDDGPGIAPEHLPRLTERFYRASVATSREKGGTGLGLAIVKHIVLRHSGELRIASKVGQGSAFTVVFEELESRH